MIAKEELNALLFLLDDPDREVNQHVFNKLTSLGNHIIPSLYDAWEHSRDNTQQTRIEQLIHNIQYYDTCADFRNWLNQPAIELIDGLQIISRLRYPDVNEYRISNELNRIKRAISMEMGDYLSPIEQVNIFNHVFYKNIGFCTLEEEFTNPDSYYLAKVIESKKGNPLSIGVIYQAIARSLGIPVYGVELPNVFCLSYMKHEQDELQLLQDNNQREILFYINPMTNGLIFTRHEIRKYLDSIEVEPNSQHFSPISTMRVLQLLLTTLNNVYQKNGEGQYAREIQNLIRMVPA